MTSRRKQKLNVRIVGKFAIIEILDTEIWDGADLALIRETLTNLIHQNGYRAIGVDLQVVKYIPSGFFGMLFEWYEVGIRVQLHYPNATVMGMSWFRFYILENLDTPGVFKLRETKVMKAHSPKTRTAFHRKRYGGDYEYLEVDEDDDEVL